MCGCTVLRALRKMQFSIPDACSASWMNWVVEMGIVRKDICTCGRGLLLRSMNSCTSAEEISAQAHVCNCVIPRSSKNVAVV